MGRLIDADVLYNRLGETNEYEEFYDLNTLIETAPTVEAIPKDQYEARLKADMVAMLTEIQLECEENTVRWYVGRVDGKSDDVVLIETLNEVIQQKIDKLRGEKSG